MNEKTNLNVLCFLNSWGDRVKKKINYRNKSIEKKKRLKLNQTWIFTLFLKYKYEVIDEGFHNFEFPTIFSNLRLESMVCTMSV